MNSDMKIKSIAPWFGGKRTMAPDIVQELGDHTQYFEPFCGSMAVLFAKPVSKKETVNDLHGDLINLAMCLKDQPVAEKIYNRAQRTIVCDGIVASASERMKEPLPENTCPERAYWYFVASWMARNGVAGMKMIDYQMAVRWTSGGGSPTVRWRSATESIPAWHKRLLNVVVTRRNAFTIIPKFEDASHTAIYVDPPYVSESRSHGDYLHDFDDEDRPKDLFEKEKRIPDYIRLSRILRRFEKSRIVVSYYDCPRVREAYKGWTFVDKTRMKNIHAQNGRGKRRAEAPEVLIINGPSYE